MYIFTGNKASFIYLFFINDLIGTSRRRRRRVFNICRRSNPRFFLRIQTVFRVDVYGVDFFSFQSSGNSAPMRNPMCNTRNSITYDSRVSAFYTIILKTTTTYGEFKYLYAYAVVSLPPVVVVVFSGGRWLRPTRRSQTCLASPSRGCGHARCSLTSVAYNP